MKWLLIIAGIAALSWWITRPSAAAPPPRKNIKMEKCPRCGVYNEAGHSCNCQDDS